MGVSKILIVETNGDVSEYRVASTPEATKTVCPACEIGIASKQNHAGSPFCENGSLASGGRYAHCQCDVCSAL